MAELWASSDVEQWQAALDRYPECIKSLAKTGGTGKSLEAMDGWIYENLPTSLRNRSPAHLTKEELVKLVDWKLTRGKWRPRLLGFAQAADSGHVVTASRAAFEVLAGNRGKKELVPAAAIKEALAALTVLKGIGPATASAALGAFDPSIPFISDESMLAALSSKEYTVPKVLQLTAALREKAAELSKSGGRAWSAMEVEKALFVAVRAGAKGGGKAAASAGSSGAAAASGSGKKRKR